jgi:hypothetical protein
VSRFITSANSLNLAGTFGFSGTVTGLADETPLVLISTFTSDGSDANATFTSGIDSTYKEYLFVFNNIHVQNNGTILTFHPSTDGGSSFGVATTNTFVESQHNEADTIASLTYDTGKDQAQNTGLIYFGPAGDSDNDGSTSGILRLYNPSSTTFVKHYISAMQGMENDNISTLVLGAGYINTTSAVNTMRFQLSSGEIQGGTIDLFGVV